VSSAGRLDAVAARIVSAPVFKRIAVRAVKSMISDRPSVVPDAWARATRRRVDSPQSRAAVVDRRDDGNATPRTRDVDANTPFAECGLEERRAADGAQVVEPTERSEHARDLAVDKGGQRGDRATTGLGSSNWSPLVARIYEITRCISDELARMPREISTFPPSLRWRLATESGANSAHRNV
jgi:hypothetical protein